VLSDGGVVHLRPVRPEDTESLRAMHSRMSDRSLYLRYFTVLSQVSDSLLRVFTEVDHHRSVALVAELGPDLIAAGTYHLDDRREAAEVAFAVQDSHQRPWTRVDPAGASGCGRAGTGHPPLHRRGAG